jgi:hypothetical protein
MAHSTVSSTITVTVCVHVLDCWYSIHWLWLQQTAALQCTVGADRMLTDVYAISCQLSTVRIVTQCDIKTTNLTYTQHNLSQPTITLYNTHLYWTALKVNFKSILFTVRWQPTFTMLLLTHQLTGVHNTNSTTFVSPSSSSFLCCCCTEHFDISKTFCFYSGR